MARSSSSSSRPLAGSGCGVPLFLFVWLSLFPGSNAIIPTAQIEVVLSNAAPGLSHYTLLASQASFGPVLPMSGTKSVAPTWTLATPPSDNANLCQEPQAATISDDTTVLLAPRGQCTFERKAYHAQRLGAKAVLIHGALASRYTVNETTSDMIWPVQYQDYDCDKGRAFVDDKALSLDVPYNAAHNDPLLSGDTTQNMCRALSKDKLQQCPSQACLLTGRTDDNKQEACCAWDLHIWLYSDTSLHNTTSTASPTSVVHIPAAYVTLQQGERLLRDLRGGTRVQLQLYERWRPQYNPSSALIWMLAVTVAALASYLSAHEYHRKRRRVLRAKERTQDNGSNNHAHDDDNGGQSPTPSPPPPPEETLELHAGHAVAFLVMASTSLLVLFYFKIYGVVKVMYALGCSKALSTILVAPALRRGMAHARIPDRVLWNIQWEDIGEITASDTVAHMVGYTLGLIWLVIAFVYYHPETVPFFWIMQDVFGACMCILFLQVVKLNSIRVAAILLVIAFFYDIFFVFVSPLIFKKSVMIDVATSGGPPPNPEWCEKYPDDPTDCRQRGNPLPMLFTIPRIADYQGGANLLGLGDIVVPGLLISFAARFDAAKSLLGVVGGGNGSIGSYACPEQKYCGSTCWNGGYFVPVVIAYGVGLLMANAAVYYMEMGQPALLYLVPCCLGMVLLIGWKRNELHDLWEGPKAIRAADVICYGEAADAGGNHHAPVPQSDDDDGGGALAVPSASDDIDNHIDNHPKENGSLHTPGAEAQTHMQRQQQ